MPNSGKAIYEFHPPKSKAGKRNIPMSKQVKEVLQEQRIWHEDVTTRFTPHCLRHTFATNCIAKGMRPKTLQKLLGHNSLQMTMDLYCHVLDETLKEEMSIIAEMV